MSTLRKLILGETWILPAGLTVALCAAGVLSGLGGEHGWWREGGGFVLLALVLGALAVALRPARR